MSFPGRSLQRAWHLVDASSQTVGRLATTVAPLLKGKHKPTYRPNADCGDYVVIINAEKVCWGCFVAVQPQRAEDSLICTEWNSFDSFNHSLVTKGLGTFCHNFIFSHPLFSHYNEPEGELYW